jgi:hypothetical protein
LRVDDFADSLYEELPPSRLYHYTSLKGLLGILDSGCIWASEVRYLNDSAEIAVAFGLMARSVGIRSTHEADPAAREILKQFTEWIDIRSSSGPMVFVTAFTQNGNLLSQWRGYSPAAQGVSFGLAATHLSAACVASKFSLGRCRYDAAEQSTAINSLLDNVLSFAERTGPSNAVHPSQSFHPAFARCEESILRVAALIKSSQFKEESEWRIVSRTVSDYVTSRIRYRVGPSMLIPFLHVPLINAGGVIPIDDVIVGPTPHAEAATESIQRCVAQHLQRKHGPWTTQYCSIPFRSW